MPLTSKMGDLERAVMDRLWARGDQSCSVREIHESLAAERDLAYTTVMTVLDRLAKKGTASRERLGRPYHYRAAASRAAMTADLMLGALAEFAPADRRAALVSFVGASTDEDRTALRDALAASGASSPTSSGGTPRAPAG